MASPTPASSLPRLAVPPSLRSCGRTNVEFRTRNRAHHLKHFVETPMDPSAHFLRPWAHLLGISSEERTPGVGVFVLFTIEILVLYVSSRSRVVFTEVSLAQSHGRMHWSLPTDCCYTHCVHIQARLLANSRIGPSICKQQVAIATCCHSRSMKPTVWADRMSLHSCLTSVLCRSCRSHWSKHTLVQHGRGFEGHLRVQEGERAKGSMVSYD